MSGPREKAASSSLKPAPPREKTKERKKEKHGKKVRVMGILRTLVTLHLSCEDGLAHCALTWDVFFSKQKSRFQIFL